MRSKLLIAAFAVSLSPVLALANGVKASTKVTTMTTVTTVTSEPWAVSSVNGNDTGGIIPWSPALRAYGYLAAAQAHCDGYHRLARITSVHPRYGDYVGFACEFPRGYDPVKAGRWWWQP